MIAVNGGDPGIQPWTDRYKRTIPFLLKLLKEPTHTLRIPDAKYSYIPKLIEMGVITKDGNTYTLIPENLVKISAVVPDEMYDNFQDINWLREQRSKLGLIKGKTKGPEYRAKQQARRKKRRQYAKEQEAKRLAQPPEDLPLSEVIFSSTKHTMPTDKE